MIVPVISLWIPKRSNLHKSSQGTADHWISEPHTCEHFYRYSGGSRIPPDNRYKTHLRHKHYPLKSDTFQQGSCTRFKQKIVVLLGHYLWRSLCKSRKCVWMIWNGRKSEINTSKSFHPMIGMYPMIGIVINYVGPIKERNRIGKYRAIKMLSLQLSCPSGNTGALSKSL